MKRSTPYAKAMKASWLAIAYANIILAEVDAWLATCNTD
jgi:hypothetical protein